MSSMFYIIGLGNPGDEYVDTRHNIGATVVDEFREAFKFSEWKIDKQSKSLISKGEQGGKSTILILPQTFMNRSGGAVSSWVKSVKSAEKTIVVYDDIDLPLGTLRIAYGRGSGGHRGVESIIKSLKTRDFMRLRVGVAPVTSSGKIRKPQGDDAVVKFLLSNFSKKEINELQNTKKSACEALDMIVVEGKEKAMNIINSKKKI